MGLAQGVDQGLEPTAQPPLFSTCWEVPEEGAVAGMFISYPRAPATVPSIGVCELVING